ncbi:MULTISPECIES: pyridoxal phosphate-dependent aminotransferase [Mycolicibacterium]|nr:MULTISPECIES: pyridoxal phosphate-dependent aminotransferase [Mycolicibacterium]QVI27157.1 pyridoxal phosphate-dependent aminotransferase [Mycolicibacterium neoaurum]
MSSSLQHPLKFAERMSHIGSVGSFDFAARARTIEAAGHDVVHFEIGEPDFPTPENIVDVAVKAMRDGATSYTASAGTAEARRAAAKYVSPRAGFDIEPESVVFVPGSKNVLYFTLLALTEPGDEVIIPDPGYPTYRALVEFLGCRAVPLALRAENDYQPDPAELASLITDKTSLVVLNVPANPTGGALHRETAEGLATVLAERQLPVYADEINCRIMFESPHVSLLEMPGMRDLAIVSDGLSKAWSMCGWRLGFGVMPPALAERIGKIMVQTSACTATFTLAAAVEAFSSPASDRAVETMVGEFRRRRDVIVQRLNAIEGITCHAPAGAFYVFPDITATGWREKELANALLDQAHVAVLPGTGFGEQGTGHIRLSFATSEAKIVEGVDRIERFLVENKR